MFKFNNTHIFTGYLKQLLAAFNLPTCRIYTKDFARHVEKYGTEDPRVIESFDSIIYTYNEKRMGYPATRIPYLRNGELYHYFWNYQQNNPKLNQGNTYWRNASVGFYNSNKATPGLTRTLNSPGNIYDTITHEYLGDYLRFLRDYYDVNLMSLYNCFSARKCNNIYYNHEIRVANHGTNSTEQENTEVLSYSSLFDSRDLRYHIYAFPVKLFADYTIALECEQGIEMFCGFYNKTLDTKDKAIDLISKTYKKINNTRFNQPFLYDKLNIRDWNFEKATRTTEGFPDIVTEDVITRWDIAKREQDLKLFIKVPVSCQSSIVVLEGDFRNFNDFKYSPKNLLDSKTGVKTGNETWEYKRNHVTVNFDQKKYKDEFIDLNKEPFTPISRLQLLAFNTGESYPFADRLVEYLSKSAITPIDEIPDNIKRVQKVMEYNQYYFKINGLWENKMQKIIYDSVMNSGPIKVIDGTLVDKHSGPNPKYYGYQPKLGHNSKSDLFDVLGYVDKDAEKLYANWIKDADGKVKMRDNIQNVDIYVDQNGKSLWDV